MLTLTGRDLIDPVLAIDRSGDLDRSTLDGIVHICEEALTEVFDLALSAFLLHDKRIMQRAARWIWDLFRACGRCPGQLPCRGWRGTSRTG
jgi:hypothetical protein